MSRLDRTLLSPLAREWAPLGDPRVGAVRVYALTSPASTAPFALLADGAAVDPEESTDLYTARLLDARALVAIDVEGVALGCVRFVDRTQPLTPAAVLHVAVAVLCEGMA